MDEGHLEVKEDIIEKVADKPKKSKRRKVVLGVITMASLIVIVEIILIVMGLHKNEYDTAEEIRGELTSEDIMRLMDVREIASNYGAEIVKDTNLTYDEYMNGISDSNNDASKTDMTEKAPDGSPRYIVDNENGTVSILEWTILGYVVRSEEKPSTFGIYQEGVMSDDSMLYNIKAERANDNNEYDTLVMEYAKYDNLNNDSYIKRMALFAHIEQGSMSIMDDILKKEEGYLVDYKEFNLLDTDSMTRYRIEGAEFSKDDKAYSAMYLLVTSGDTNEFLYVLSMDEVSLKEQFSMAEKNLSRLDYKYGKVTETGHFD